MIWHSGSTPDARAEIFTLNKSGWSGVILTNKNHVLEETALSVLKKGIISILNGEEPVDILKNTINTNYFVGSYTHTFHNINYVN